MQVLKPHIDKILRKTEENNDEVILLDIVQFAQDVTFRREIITRVLDKLSAGYIVYTNLPKMYFDPVMNYVNQIKNIYDYEHGE